MNLAANAEDGTVLSPAIGALDGLGEQAFTSDQGHKLLRMLAPAQWPKPGTAAPAENDRSDFHGGIREDYQDVI